MRPNPDIDPAAILDGYLDQAAYPGDDAVDDAMVSAMAFFDGKKDGVIFQNLLRSYAAEAKKNQRRGLEYWSGTFDGEFLGTWMEYLSAMLGIVVFGNDQLSFKPIDQEWWDLRLPDLKSQNPPNWHTISAVMRGLLGDRYEDHVKTCLQHAPDGGWYEWSAWYGLNDVIRRANATTFVQELARRPFFDCAWYYDDVRRNLIEVIDQTESSQTLRLRLERPTGFPTLLAYFWRLYWEVATKAGSVAVDENLAEEYAQEAALAADDVDELPGQLAVGSYSTGSLLMTDLLPTALQVYELGTVGTPEERERLQRWMDMLPDDEHDDWWGSYEADMLFEEVVNEINHLLGEYGVYFGGHPGDGADWGIWANDEDDWLDAYGD